MKKPRSSIIRVFADEDALWDYVSPRLRGWWTKLEAVTPDGLTDWLGLWDSRTWWCEAKIGKPGLDALRPSQRRFAYACIDNHIEHWTCFGYKGEARFFRDLDFDTERVPPFHREARPRSR